MGATQNPPPLGDRNDPELGAAFPRCAEHLPRTGEVELLDALEKKDADDGRRTITGHSVSRARTRGRRLQPIAASPWTSAHPEPAAAARRPARRSAIGVR